MSSWTVLLSGLLVLVAFFYVRFKLFTSKYWSERNVPHLDPVFLFGNAWGLNFVENIFVLLKRLHAGNGRNKILGYWMFTKPQLLVTDLELAKRILIRDFNVFTDRGFEINEDADPLSEHLLMMRGKRWRNLRVKLTPTFTSGKMRLMLPTMVKCGEDLERHLRTVVGCEDVDVKDLMSRFTTDIIASCAFGIEVNSLENPQSEFRKYGTRAFSPELKDAIVGSLLFLYPRLSKIFSLSFVPKAISDFFIATVTETVEYRERNNVTRNDFLQLLIQLIRAGKVEDADREATDVQDEDDDGAAQRFSLSQAAAQCFLFFIGGFETSSSALTYALYELALNPDIQRSLQMELDEEVKGPGLSYEVMSSMKYLDMVVRETLRKYPPIGFLQRVSNAEYRIPELNATLEKGTTVMISVWGFHYDPDLYPDPEKFDPERFSPDAKGSRDSTSFLAFGEGPRNCIGNRFALMQVKVGLISVLKKYNVEVSSRTPMTVKYQARNFSPTPVGGMQLRFTERT